jgi:hypothetical protein
VSTRKTSKKRRFLTIFDPFGPPTPPFLQIWKDAMKLLGLDLLTPPFLIIFGCFLVFFGVFWCFLTIFDDFGGFDDFGEIHGSPRYTPF